MDESTTHDLYSKLTEDRHFPVRPAKANVGISRNYAIRKAAKRLAASKNQHFCENVGITCLPQPSHTHGSLKEDLCRYNHKQSKRNCRSHWTNFLATSDAVNAHARSPRLEGSGKPPKKAFPSTLLEEGRDLAMTDIALPSDRYRLTQCPSLGREDAFYDATTTRRRIHVHKPLALTEDAEIAELYRQGILYDEGQAAQQAFDLNSIQHDVPLYHIRPWKRARKGGKAHAAAPLKKSLHLDLSFADLGNDEAIARFLMSPTHSQGSDDEAIQHASQSSGSSPPLRVIYELTGSRPSIDVDASQPPDLVLDSEYDCFSDSEFNDDSPSQREVHDPQADPPTDTWIMLGDDL